MYTEVMGADEASLQQRSICAPMKGKTMSRARKSFASSIPLRPSSLKMPFRCEPVSEVEKSTCRPEA